MLFLDEPTGALDEDTGRNVLDLLLRLRRERKFAMITVTHNANIAETADCAVGERKARQHAAERVSEDGF